MVKPVIPPSNGQLNRCNNCKGTNETNPAGITVKSKSLTTPVKMFITLTKQLRKIDDTQDAILQEILSLRTQISQTAQTEEEKKQLENEAAPLIAKLREKFNVLEKPKKEVTEKLHKAETSQHYATLKQFADFQTALSKLIPVWEQKPLSIRKEFINLIVHEAIVTIVAPHWVQLDLYWTHPQWEAQHLYIPRPRGSRPEWTEEEKTVMRKQYATTPKDTLLQLLPTKNWGAIVKMAEHLGIRRTVFSSYPIPHHLSWEDIQFMQEHAIPLDQKLPVCLPISAGEGEEETDQEPTTYPNFALQLRPGTTPYR